VYFILLFVKAAVENKKKILLGNKDPGYNMSFQVPVTVPKRKKKSCIVNQGRLQNILQTYSVILQKDAEWHHTK
jgi:hypothetical protein